MDSSAGYKCSGGAPGSGADGVVACVAVVVVVLAVVWLLTRSARNKGVKCEVVQLYDNYHPARPPGCPATPPVAKHTPLVCTTGQPTWSTCMPITTPPVTPAPGSASAEPKDTGLYQPFYSEGSGAWGYNSIRSTLPPHYKKYTRAMQSATDPNKSEQLPYLYSDTAKIFVSYDDTQSIQKKAAFAKENNLGGIMNWHAGVDYYDKNNKGELLRAALKGWSNPPISLTYLGIGFGDNPCNLLDMIKSNSPKCGTGHLTHVNLAFFALDQDFNVVLPKPPPQMVRGAGAGAVTSDAGEYDLNHEKILVAPGTKMTLNKLVSTLKQCGLTVLASLGGWNITNSENYGPNFQQASSSKSNIQKCASACASFVKMYDLDGLDVDWEYPGRNPQYSICGSECNRHCALNEMNGPTCLDKLDNNPNQKLFLDGKLTYMHRPASCMELDNGDWHSTNATEKSKPLGTNKPGNAADYKELMMKIKSELHTKLLTATVDAATWALHWYGWVLKDLVTLGDDSTFDYVGIMAYDYNGNWQSTPITGWNANLYVDQDYCTSTNALQATRSSSSSNYYCIFPSTAIKPPKMYAGSTPGPCFWSGMDTSSSGAKMGCPQLLYNNLQPWTGPSSNPYGTWGKSSKSHAYLSISNIVTDLFINQMSLPSKRLVLGLPFYGRYFNLKPPTSGEQYPIKKNNCTSPSGSTTGGSPESSGCDNGWKCTDTACSGCWTETGTNKIVNGYCCPIDT